MRIDSFAVLVSAFVVTGCGVQVPNIAEFNEPSTPILSSSGKLEINVKEKVYCDIIQSIVDNKNLLPKKWAVQVTLDLEVDESGSFNPGVSLIKPLPTSQSFTLGLGATGSSEATREDKFGNYWSADRINFVPDNPCHTTRPVGDSFLIESDLGVSSWLHDALISYALLPSSPLGNKADSAYKQDYLSYHLKFIVISGGNINPVWKLVRIGTGNGSLPLASVNRTRTHDLLVTFGPAFKPGSPNLPIASHENQEIGISLHSGSLSNTPQY